jgi:hypothetical protein
MVVRREVSDRTVIGKVFKWAFILFNLFMLYALLSGIIGAGEAIEGASSEAERAGAGIGTMLGVGALMTFWVMGDVILGLFVLFTRRKKIIETDD